MFTGLLPSLNRDSLSIASVDFRDAAPQE